MVAIRNWRAVTPVVAHESAIVWSFFRSKGTEGSTEAEAPLEKFSGFTLHRMQSGKNGDYHQHEDREQLYYFTEGRGKMKIDDKIYAVRQGDAVHVSPRTRHQLINDSDDWIEHLIITGPQQG